LEKIDSQELDLILAARHHDPFSYLGLHKKGAQVVFRAFIPGAIKVSLWLDEWVVMKQIHQNGMFEWHGKVSPSTPCKLKIEFPKLTVERVDTYSFLPVLTDDELYLFGAGQLHEAYSTLGSRLIDHQSVKGVRFAVWAPNAERVSVVGNFNQWDGRVNPMRVRGSSGVWELFVPHLEAGELYKFEIRNRNSGAVLTKADPYAQAFEPPPGNAAKIVPAPAYQWQDQDWLTQRARLDWLHAPFNCYEVHLGSWRRNAQAEFLTYRESADLLVKYVVEMGYTHIELLPVTEHPLNESWGYQTTGYFAATNRFGSPDDLRYLIDCCHLANIGVILDWVPGHFPKDDWALARFDGTALYEHEDPRLGEHQDWGTYIFNYARNEVRGFLVSSAYFWLKEFHIDGLRVDAVASMLYLDYSRKEGQWLPNKFGGRENLDAIEFLKGLNTLVHELFPGALTIAEESTAWPAVSRPVYLGGLGFSMKWNMGWMNDTLSYIEHDPVHRRFHHDKLTFSQIYAYSENFVLPFSHDEVVHGKKSLLDKMPGDAWQKFANLRLLLSFQMTHPGKKLNFMGNEFAHGREWNVNQSLDWHLLESYWHQGVQKACRDLNHIYHTQKALHDLDFEQNGFEWIDCHDQDQSIISYVRRARDGSFVIIVLNFTPVTRTGYRIGVPETGYYQELFNSDAECYGGSNQGNGTGITAEHTSWMQRPYSLLMTVPPLGAVILNK
jgi:1,4-alpha-glucan branching enzyme